jgi:hypothetical protein
MRDLMKKFLLPSTTRPRRILSGPAAGLMLEIDPKREFRLWLGLYEAELSRHFHRLIYPGARCFDIGGAEGYHSIMLARLSGEPVAVFEIGTEWIDKIERELSRNGLRGDVIPEFVGDRVGDGFTTIDAAAERFFVPDFIKMDIEGSEADALAGACNVLCKRMPNMIIEVHGLDIENRCLEILASHGYRPEIVSPRSFLAEHRPIPHNRWLICEGKPSP